MAARSEEWGSCGRTIIWLIVYQGQVIYISFFSLFLQWFSYRLRGKSKNIEWNPKKFVYSTWYRKKVILKSCEEVRVVYFSVRFLLLYNRRKPTLIVVEMRILTILYSNNTQKNVAWECQYKKRMLHKFLLYGYPKKSCWFRHLGNQVKG